MAGLLDFLASPDAQSGIGLLAAAGPRFDGAGFGQRLQEGLAYGQTAKDAELKRQYMLLQQQKQAMEVDAMKRQVSDQDAQRSILRGFSPGGASQAALQSAPANPLQAAKDYPVDPQVSGDANMPAYSSVQSPSNALTGAVPPKVDKFTLYNSMGDKLTQGGQPEAAQKYYDIAEKFRPKYSTTPQQMMVGGKLTNVLVSEDGTMKTLDGFGVKPDMTNVNLGGTDQWVDKNSVTNGQTMQRTQSPDSIASGQIAIRGQNMTDARKKQELDGAEAAFTPDAIANAASRYNIDGTLPPMGMGKTGSLGRAAILNKAAELAAASGQTGDEQRINQIGNKANSAALSKIQQSQTMVGAFEKNFTANADLALKQSSAVDLTGVPLANKWINAGRRAVNGDPQLSAYDAVIKSTANEYAKIISGSMGNTAMAESEIRKVEALLNSAQTPEQVASVISMMKQETANRMKGFDDEKKALRSSMSGTKPADAATPDQQSFKMLPNASGYAGKRMRSDNGAIYRSDGTKWIKE